MLRFLSLAFQQDKLLICEVQKLIDDILSKPESLTITRRKNLDHLKECLTNSDNGELIFIETE